MNSAIDELITEKLYLMYDKIPMIKFLLKSATLINEFVIIVLFNTLIITTEYYGDSDFFDHKKQMLERHGFAGDEL